jgi:hypothetical protein
VLSASSRLFDLNSEANRVRKKQSSAIIAVDVRRFGHIINKDEVFGTHNRRRSSILARLPAKIPWLSVQGNNFEEQKNPPFDQAIPLLLKSGGERERTTIDELLARK